MASLKTTNERLRHVNRVLRAVRNVDQLIVQAPNQESLLQGTCDCLTGTQGYFNAWIALFDPHLKLIASYESGLGERFPPLLDRLKAGDFPRCVRQLHDGESMISLEEPPMVCGDCPLAASYSGRGGMAVRLTHQGIVYGVMIVSVPIMYAGDQEEQDSLAELSRDIGFALHTLKTKTDLRMRRHLPQGLPHPTAIVDMDYRYRAVNEAHTDFFGKSSADSIGKHMAEFYGAPLFNEEIKPCMDRCLAGGNVTHEIQLDYPQKGPKWMAMFYTPYRDETGAVKGILAHGTDITEHKRHEADLRKARERAKRVIDYGPIAITRVDLNGQIVDANKEAVNLLGLQNDKELGQKHRNPKWLVANLSENPFSPDELPFRQAVDTDKSVFDLRREVTLTDGRRLLLSINAAPMHDNQGRISEVVFAFQDITGKQKVQEQLLQSEKMKAIGQLAGGIAHGLNNQLTGVLGYGDLLVDQLDDPVLRGYAEKICAVAWRSAELTQNLLTFARKGQFISAPVDIHATIRETVEILKYSVDRRIQIRQRLHARESMVVGDPSHLKHALINLALNALDAMAEGGILTFTTDTAKISRSAAVDQGLNIQPGPYIIVAIEDTGPGIAKHILPHIFEPFYTTKEQGKGTGMGLASVYGTIMHYEGAITVDSVVDKGTRFKIYLPLASNPPQDEPDTYIPPDSAGNLTILVVDDEKIIQDLGREILSAEGHTVLCAADGCEAIQMYRDQWRAIDVVVLDAVMPKVNGLDAFRAMKGINPRIKAILASGYNLKEESKSILEEGVLCFVQKPFDKSRLIGAIQHAFLTSPPKQQSVPPTLF